MQIRVGVKRGGLGHGPPTYSTVSSFHMLFVPMFHLLPYSSICRSQAPAVDMARLPAIHNVGNPRNWAPTKPCKVELNCLRQGNK